MSAVKEVSLKQKAEKSKKKAQRTKQGKVEQRTMTLAEIEKGIAFLTPEEQLKLVEQVIRQLRKKTHVQKKKLDIDKLYGLGKGLWDDEDAQEYVNRLREDRKCR